MCEGTACATVDRMKALLGARQSKRLETDSVREPGKMDYRTAHCRFEFRGRTWVATEHSSTHRRTLRASSRYHSRPALPVVSNAEESRRIRCAAQNSLDRRCALYTC